MHVVVTLVGIVVTVLVVAGLCRRFDLPSPLILILVGIVGSYLPFVPAVHLRPEVVLLGLLPPLLYAAAIQTSLIDVYANRRSILLLSIGLVAFTTAGVAVLVHWLLPGVGWSGSFAIGAVVAPPDAVAATTIGRRIGLPRRLVTILEGESLLNDATALVALRTALAATVAWQHVVGDFAVAAVGGVVVGVVGFVLVAFVRKRVEDPLFDSGLSFVTPFAAYVAAEEIHASGVIAVVVAGILLGHKAPIIQTARSRIAEQMNWSAIGFLLESAVFLLIGLQARRIIGDAVNGDVTNGRVVLVCGSVLVAVIVLRVVWMFAAQPLLAHGHRDTSPTRPSWRRALLLGWAGMRGVVTLAAAFTIPDRIEHRDTLLLVAFTVTAGTLILQGFTLPWLAGVLRLPPPDPGADALARANLVHQASQAGLARLDELDEDDPHEVSAQLRERVRRRADAAWERMGGSTEETPSEIYGRRRKEMIDAERARVLEVRDSGTVAHEIVDEVLRMLDVEESMIDTTPRDPERVRAAIGVELEGGCEHLRECRPPVEPDTPGECGDCLVEGTAWVHLRMCVICGHIACCDSSPRRHATAHFDATGHPVMRSAEPGEDWRWCYVDELTG